jgi:hypothetical protein
MATIGVGAGSYIRPYRNVRTERWLVDTSQTVKVGHLLVLGTDSGEENRAKVAGADPTTDRLVLGFAAEDLTTGATHNAATDHVLVWVADNDSEFIGHVCGAAVADQALAAAQISAEYGLLADATNVIWRLDISETSAKLARIQKLVDAVGDVNGRVVFRVIAPERLLGD